MGRKRKAFRRQRVALRQKRRQELKERFQKVLFRGTIVAMIGGLALGLVAQGDSFFGQFVRRHTPAVDLRMSETLTGLPALDTLPTNHFWLWFPGVNTHVNKCMVEQFPAVRAVTFERRFTENKIIVRVVGRTPLVRTGAVGLDGEGVAFPIPDGRWTAIPQATFSPTLSRAVVSRWLLSLSQTEGLWEHVTAVSDDKGGSLLLDLNTGTRVVWGAPELNRVKAKVVGLTHVLKDAHEHLGGASSADLRFFDEGRIIVRPKMAKG